MNNQTTRELAIEWWGDVIEKDAAIYRMQYFNTRDILNDDQIEHIYLSEHPQTETIKEEDVQVGGFTKGKWEIGGTSRGLNNYYIKADNQNIAQIFSSIPECEANAQRIVTCVNNFDAMYSALKDILNLDLNMGELLSDIDCPQINKAKAIINQIDNK